jgi:hypothetical protein
MRIEQLPNGSYVRKLNYIEDQIIQRLYKEVGDRKAGDEALRIRIELTEEGITSLDATIQALRLRMNKMDEDHAILLPLIPHFTDLKKVNEQQDTRLIALEEQNTVQDERLVSAEGVNTTQDTRLTNIEAMNLQQNGRLDANDAKNTEQDTRLDGIDTKNTEQDTKIAELETTIANKSDIHLTGSANFTSTTGTTIPHAIGHTNYRVSITPTQNPNGYLGEVWVIKATNSFTVFCSGSATTSFDYIALG